MAPNPRRRAAQLDALYDRLPKMECQGLCHDTCGPIEVSVVERVRMEKAAGRELSCGVGASCSMLTPQRTCGVYDVRPILCRLWGLIESLPCHYGCRPDGGLLTDAEGYRFMAEVLQIGGDPGGQEAQHRRVVTHLLASKTPQELVELGRQAAALTTPRPRLEARDAALPPTSIERRYRG